jgi:hypothetical protein
MAVIKFLIDSTKLPQGGSSITAPAAVGHPAFLLNGQLQSNGDYQVPVREGEEVTIYTLEANQVTGVKLAPCGIIAHQFGSKPCTVDMMKDPAQRPFNIPEFDMEFGPQPDFIKYNVNDNPQWQPAPGTWPYWAKNPVISEDVQANLVQTYVPYASFTVSKLVSGLLNYGLEFAMTKDGKTVQYFYFDPYLLINP